MEKEVNFLFLFHFEIALSVTLLSGKLKVLFTSLKNKASHLSLGVLLNARTTIKYSDKVKAYKTSQKRRYPFLAFLNEDIIWILILNAKLPKNEGQVKIGVH